MVDVTKVYRRGETQPIVALDHVTLEVARADFVAVVGPSGSGKSTLLHIMGCLDRPTSGRLLLAGEDVTQIPRRRLAGIRNLQVGFIFQQYHLIPTLTALENTAVPMRYRGLSRRQAHMPAAEWLDRVGLGDRLHHFPSELSGGEQQRVAVARALVNEPSVVLADEPTGELDTRASDRLMHLLQQLNTDRGATFVIVTHDHDVAGRCRRAINLRDGGVVRDERSE